jgi:glycosyltransferase involved in cell wall biosynthesis
MRIGFVSEWLQGLGDEGIHNFVQSWSKYCGREHQVREFAVGFGADLLANRLFLSLPLRANLRGFDPDMVFYISPSCAKVTALFRAKVLKAFAPHTKVFVVSLQPVEYGNFERRLLPLLAPDSIFVQSAKSMELLSDLPCPVHFLPSGVDTDRFAPVTQDQKMKLRQRYGIHKKAFVILHVGHINRNRNVQLLISIAQEGYIQVIMVGSTSTSQDEGLVEELMQAQVRVFREYLPHVEEIYQLADLYFFPVMSEDAAIGVPLSVLEAMACNLTVITTRFGGLPLMFKEEGGLFYFDHEDDLPELIARVKGFQRCSTRKMVEPYDWKNVAQMMLEMATSREDRT